MELVQNAKQAQEVLRSHTVSVNGKRIHHKDDAVAFMDILTVGKDNYRVLINKNNTLTVEPVKKGEDVTLQRLRNKTTLKGGKTQLNFESGMNLIADKKCAVGDTLVIDLKRKITDHYPLKKGATVFVTGGRHIGVQGTVEKIDNNTITIKAGKETLETNARYAYAIGKDKPGITI